MSFTRAAIERSLRDDMLAALLENKVELE